MSLKRIAPALALFAVTAAAQVSVPYTEDFSAALGPEWSLSSSDATGRIILGQNGSVSPLSGGDALVMDSSTNGGSDVTNEAALSIDLATTGGGVLRYYFKETSDEADAPDGVFLTDGVTTIQIADHTTLTSTWTEITVDLTVAAGAAGLALTTNMEIIFSQSDNFPVPTDGAFFDDVRVTLPPPPDTGQANSALASMDLNGGLNLNGQPAVMGINGPFFAGGSVMSFTFMGEPSQRYVLLFGNLLRNAAVVPPVGSLDLDLPSIVIVLDGNSPGFLNSLAQLDATGTSVLTFGTGALPPGLLGTFQGIVFNTGATIAQFTAAFELSVQ